MEFAFDKGRNISNSSVIVNFSRRALLYGVYYLDACEELMKQVVLVYFETLSRNLASKLIKRNSQDSSNLARKV